MSDGCFHRTPNQHGECLRRHHTKWLFLFADRIMGHWTDSQEQDFMEPDDELCLCFHVTKRKVQQFLRVERPQRVSQLSECGGAGTGCGWCRPFLAQLFLQAVTPPSPAEWPDAQAYARQRRDYIRAGKGTPPPGSEPEP
jgi:NAD(P)H-nitrite reductase large subunit